MSLLFNKDVPLHALEKAAAEGLVKSSRCTAVAAVAAATAAAAAAAGVYVQVLYVSVASGRQQQKDAAATEGPWSVCDH